MVSVSKKYPCPCCGYKTLTEEACGSYDICPVCFWEDDPIQLDDMDYEGGANRVSLRQGQRNFLEYGACERKMIKHTRPPTSEEQRDEHWKPLD